MELQGYQINELVYESNHSRIYRGHHLPDQTPIICKQLKQENPTLEIIARFQQEYDITRHLDIPQVINVYDLIHHQNRWHMIVEDFAGIALNQHIPATGYTLANFFPLAIQIAGTLAQVHQHHIIHKDINPTNIIYNAHSQQLKLIDFGIATRLSRETPSFRNPNVLEGTLAYMSPEQTGRMNRALDYRTDFYALGVTFYHMLTGQLPFTESDPLALVHCHLAQSPQPPHTHKPTIPPTLSDIVLKLMAKDVEDRYHSAQGLQADLETCWQQWQAQEKIDPFPLAQQDFSARFQIPDKLYGREKEIEQLLQAFARASQGASEMMLVAGPAGMGKSALVREVYKPLTQQHGYAIAGKYDQLQRDIPYSALIQAFQDLTSQILTESETNIAYWQQQLLNALGVNGQVVIDVIPEVALIIGTQSPVLELEPVETQNRFTYVFQSFIRVFTQREHPLALFLDDLQWADAASLNLIEQLIGSLDSQYFFLMGAYRNDEVSSAHPLHIALKNIKQAGVTINEVVLSPLTLSQITQIVADTLNHDPAHIEPLAQLVLDKTGGNPFFVTEFLSTLYREQLLTFDPTQGQWQWELEQIRRQNITNNVVELMSAKIQQLPATSQHLLSLSACIGNRFDLQTVALISQHTPQETANALWEAMTIGLILPLNNAYQWANLEPLAGTDSLTVEYKFAHDRIQQAAYALIPQDQLESTHHQVGQLLLQNTSPEKQEKNLFNIVNHLNIALNLLQTAEEKEQLVRLNLTAGKKAKASAAYMPAFKYLSTARDLLPPNAWQTNYTLTLSLYTELIEITYLIGDFTQMEPIAQTVFAHAQNILDTVPIYKTLILGYTAHNEFAKAVDIGIEGINKLGESIPPNFGMVSVIIALLRTQWALRHWNITDLENLPAMTDPHQLAIIDLQMAMVVAVFSTRTELYAFVACENIRRFLQYGNMPNSAPFYGAYGMILCSIVGDIPKGYEFAQLGLKLMEKSGTPLSKASAILACGLVLHWQEHLENTLRDFEIAYRSALETGNISILGTGVVSFAICTNFIGQNLEKFIPQIKAYRQILENFKQKVQVSYMGMHQQAAFHLMQLVDTPNQLIGDYFNEAEMYPIYVEKKNKQALVTLYLYKAFFSYLFAKPSQAIEYIEQAKPNMGGALSTIVIPLLYFYESLAWLAIYEQQPIPKQWHIRLKVAGNQRKSKKWAHHAPMNHLQKYYLVEAELARVLGKTEKATTYYDQAIQAAQENKYANEEALACELAGKFYLNKGQNRFAALYFQDAHYAYQRWGAKAKMQDLEINYPQFFTKAVNPDHTVTTLTTTTGSTVIANLDFASVLKASQALSGEIQLDNLITKLMAIVIENAGAQLGYLLTKENDQWHIVAQDGLNQTPATSPDNIPLTLILYVARTKQSVVLHEATREGKFTQDPYILTQQPKSILCMPLLNQSKISGILYLENNLTTHAFTLDKLQTLSALSAQAAISLENAHLYTHLEQLVAERTKELSETNDYLSASNAELDAFAHTVAHDLKNPLAGVIGFAKLLEMHGPDSPKRGDLTQHIIQSGEKMKNIIDNLLLLANLRQGEVNISPLNFTEIIADVKLRLSHMIQETEATIETQAEYPVALGYAPWVEEILANYLSNAMKYGGNPPHILIGATPQADDTIQLWVQDNGQGLTPEQCSKLFTPFTRVTEVTSIEGHGLGLSIVQRIAGKLNGTVGVESEVGKGSRFYCTLPAS